MKVHVTGGSGFTGQFVLRELISRGHEVSALVRSSDAAARVRSVGAIPVPGDLDDSDSLRRAFTSSDADHLVNVASLGFGHAPLIMEAAVAAGFDRGVFVSTTALFTTLNAPSKSVRTDAEATVRSGALRWTIVRPTMIYGTPGDRNVARLLRVLRRAPLVPLPGGGHGLMQPVHVEDLATGIVQALEVERAVGESINIPGPSPMSFRDLILSAASAVGRRPVLVPVPFGPVMTAVRLLEDRGAAPRVSSEQLERLQEDKAFDVEPAQTLLGLTGRSFDEGVRAEAAMLAPR
jgi:nucleoside-diphosphate-sugar epimerase